MTGREQDGFEDSLKANEQSLTGGDTRTPGIESEALAQEEDGGETDNLTGGDTR